VSGDERSRFWLLLRWNPLPAENRAHPAIEVAGARDGAARRLHPGGAHLAHVPPDDRKVPRFLALGLVVRAGFILEIAVGKALDDRVRVGAGLVERRGETERFNHHLMNEIGDRLA